MQTASTRGRLFRWPLHEPEAPAVDHALFARPFGQPEDLDVDFRGVPRPVAVTAVLLRCLRTREDSPLDESSLWQWPVTRRMQGLLAVAEATGGETWGTTGQCRNTECGEWMEIPLQLSIFRSAAEEESFRWFPAGQTEFEVRIPTGEDQMRMADEFEEDPMLLARRLICGGEATRMCDEWLPELEAALAERDRLTDVRLTARCPYCGQECEFEFDLEAFLLAELERWQAAQLDSVHRLAAGYHWSEAEILVLPAWRREYYLDALEREGLR